MSTKILIADDEADIVSMLRSFFESKNYFVLSAKNGTEALKQVEQKPDIILLDINMPELDGLKVCERIRDYVSCPILFLTARIEDTDKVKSCINQLQFKNAPTTIIFYLFYQSKNSASLTLFYT